MHLRQRTFETHDVEHGEDLHREFDSRQSFRKVRSKQIKQDKLGAGDQRAPQNPSPGYPPEKRAAVNGPYNCKYDLTTHGDI